MERCIALLALLVAAHGVVNAQNVARWSWQEPQAKVLPTGDLEWAPKAFEFKASESVRYIDFESGNDANDGFSKQTPWKHHPWDPNASGKAAACKGAQTYVGGTPQGHNLNGAIDFMRIARGTLGDAKTTIDELYAWEFNGPFLDDFTGRRRPANGGCAGAIDEDAQ